MNNEFDISKMVAGEPPFDTRTEREIELEEELQCVLGDWNMLIEALGLESNGTAIGRARQLRADAERYRCLQDNKNPLKIK